MDTSVLNKSITNVKEVANKFFEAAIISYEKSHKEDWMPIEHYSSPNKYWDELSEETKGFSQKAQEYSLHLIAQIIPILKSSPLLNESDERDIGLYAKRMRAALRLREYKSWDTEILHDEDQVLGVSPPGQSDADPSEPQKSKNNFTQCIEQIDGILQLLKITPTHIPNGLPDKNPNLHQSYRPNTAFIMMPIKQKDPELEDIYETYKTCFDKFGIKAIRADEIEHEDVITKKIIEEITISEFLVGDLTRERPSVYYEIGYAHSLGRRVILYRKYGTSIHFDLAAYNCPEYRSMTELRKFLIKRLEEATNRKPQG